MEKEEELQKLEDEVLKAQRRWRHLQAIGAAGFKKEMGGGEDSESDDEDDYGDNDSDEKDSEDETSSLTRKDIVAYEIAVKKAKDEYMDLMTKRDEFAASASKRQKTAVCTKCGKMVL